MRYDHYIRSTVGRIFKLLPLREQTELGANIFLDAYIGDLANEMAGSMVTFPELCEIPPYVGAVNNVNYMRHHWEDIPFQTYRSAVLKMTNSLTKMLGEDEEVQE